MTKTLAPKYGIFEFDIVDLRSKLQLAQAAGEKCKALGDSAEATAKRTKPRDYHYHLAQKYIAMYNHAHIILFKLALALELFIDVQFPEGEELEPEWEETPTDAE